MKSFIFYMWKINFWNILFDQLNSFYMEQDNFSRGGQPFSLMGQIQDKTTWWAEILNKKLGGVNIIISGPMPPLPHFPIFCLFSQYPVQMLL